MMSWSPVLDACMTSSAATIWVGSGRQAQAALCGVGMSALTGRFSRSHFGIAAIQQGHAGVAEPAHHPPQPHGHGAVAVVIYHHLLVDADPPLAELFGQHARIGQRMPPRGFADGGGQVVVQMHITCTRDVGFLVGLATGLGIGEGEAAVENDPVRVVQMRGQVFSGNEGVGKHE